MAASEPSVSDSSPFSDFLLRHEFLLRRLHSLTGLIPVGAYMIVHLTVNASILNGEETFQHLVYLIHSLGKILPLVEWVFIFLPIIFHAAFGFLIIFGGVPNQNKYRYGPNWRYFLQRVTGVIAFFFIFWHVFHLHGWFHAEWWLKGVAEPLGGANFHPYNASSSLGEALRGYFVVLLYAIGMLSCVYHLANGIWTMGITWGAWTSPTAQKYALRVCAGFGVVMAVVGLSALGGAHAISDPETVQQNREREDEMYEERVKSGSIYEDEHKRAGHTSEGDQPETEADQPPAPTE